MTIYIAHYEFEGPLDNTDQVQPKPGIAAILDRNDGDRLVDITHGADLRHQLLNHKNRKLWKKLTFNNLRYAVLYTNFPSRELNSKLMEIEMSIREHYGRDLRKIPPKKEMRPKTFEKT